MIQILQVLSDIAVCVYVCVHAYAHVHVCERPKGNAAKCDKVNF